MDLQELEIYKFQKNLELKDWMENFEFQIKSRNLDRKAEKLNTYVKNIKAI